MGTLLTGRLSNDEEILVSVLIGSGWRELSFYLGEKFWIWIRSGYGILLRCSVFVCRLNTALVILCKRHWVLNHPFFHFLLLNHHWHGELVLLRDSFGPFGSLGFVGSLGQETCHDSVGWLLMIMLLWDCIQLPIKVNHISELLNCLIVFAERIRSSHWRESVFSYSYYGILFDFAAITQLVCWTI